MSTDGWCVEGGRRRKLLHSDVIDFYYNLQCDKNRTFSLCDSSVHLYDADKEKEKRIR